MEERENELNALERALQEATTDADRLQAQLALAKHLEPAEHLQSSIAFDASLALALKLNNRAAEAECQEGKARMLWKMSDNPKAHKHYSMALEIHTELGNYYGMATCYGGLGMISSMSEEHSAALEFFELALSASRRAEHDSYTAVVVANIGNVYFALGRYDDAMACFERALDYHQKQHNLKEVAVMLNGIAGVYVYTERFEEGLELLHKALANDKKVGNTLGVITAMYNIGETLRKQGKLKEAVAQQLQTLKLAKKTNYQLMIYQGHEHLSVLYDLLEEPEKATHHLQLLMQAERDEKKWQVKKANEKLQRFGGDGSAE
jgi:tetratricopeptide (TPR) repeat protein